MSFLGCTRPLYFSLSALCPVVDVYGVKTSGRWLTHHYYQSKKKKQKKMLFFFPLFVLCVCRKNSAVRRYTYSILNNIKSTVLSVIGRFFESTLINLDGKLSGMSSQYQLINQPYCTDLFGALR